MKIGNREIHNKNLAVAAAGLVILVVAAWLTPFFLTGAPADGLVKLRRGSTIEVAADSLAKNIDTAFASRVASLLHLTGTDLSKRQGAFKVSKGDSPFTTMRRLRSGQPSGIRFTFNNVRTLDEWATRWGDKFMAGKEAMMAALTDSALCAKEGKTVHTIGTLLLPDSYEFYWDITPEKMLDRMHDYHDRFWTAERRAKASRLGLTPEQVSIIASIVEEETAKADERGMVARLYINRFQSGMRLQADPTVKFAIGDFSIRRLTVPMTLTASPYNTYRVDGLPPGPIRLPEKATLDAVLNAPEHNYIYMCAREDFSGRHNFAVDYAEHMANARRYQAALNARGIK